MNRMTGLTDQLLAYAQEGKYQSKIVSIRKLVEDTLGLVQHTFDPLIQIETDLQDEPLTVEADIAQMQMAFSAILANATEAVEGKGRIKISGSNGIHPEPGPGQHNESGHLEMAAGERDDRRTVAAAHQHGQAADGHV